MLFLICLLLRDSFQEENKPQLYQGFILTQNHFQALLALLSIPAELNSAFIIIIIIIITHHRLSLYLRRCVHVVLPVNFQPRRSKQRISLLF